MGAKKIEPGPIKSVPSNLSIWQRKCSFWFLIPQFLQKKGSRKIPGVSSPHNMILADSWFPHHSKLKVFGKKPSISHYPSEFDSISKLPKKSKKQLAIFQSSQTLACFFPPSQLPFPGWSPSRCTGVGLGRKRRMPMMTIAAMDHATS